MSILDIARALPAVGVAVKVVNEALNPPARPDRCELCTHWEARPTSESPYDGVCNNSENYSEVFDFANGYRFTMLSGDGCTMFEAKQ